ncbi:MAG TPA: AAA family ATPase, partial [Kineosporiaceae bacterium]|nr:AAA family ATPase [Kineosporiaceae bacterium]
MNAQKRLRASPGMTAGAGTPLGMCPPAGEPYAATLESHLSVVLLIGSLALKFKKPLALPFIDLSTREARRRVSTADLDLNRRLAPDVYLGLAELRVPGVPEIAGEPVLVMRRLPHDRRLSELLGGEEDLRPVLNDVARQMVCLHAAQRSELNADLLGTTTLLWQQGCEQLTGFAPDPLDRDRLVELAALVAEYLAGRGDLLRGRENRGLVRDGHGDLLADDLFCLPDGVRILDCLEFDRRLRVNDVLADIAFLAMDLDLRAAPDLARYFVDRYREHSAETHPRSLEHHYIAYRAFVRAKVECLRHEQGAPEAAARARRLLELALDHLRAARVHLVLVGGLPGSGKSTLAAEVAASRADDHEWVLLSSDAVRRDLFGGTGSAGAAPFGSGAYDAEHTRATYAELLRRARLALSDGRSVLLDASWTSAAHRRAAGTLARECTAVLTQVRCEIPVTACARRLATRTDARGSDADADVLRELAARVDPWPAAAPVSTDGPVAEAAEAVLDLLAGAPIEPIGHEPQMAVGGPVDGRESSG